MRNPRSQRNGYVTANRALLDMSFGAPEQALPDECFAKEQLNVLLGPVASGEGLEEHHDLLKIHLQQLVSPLDKECCADVKMEVREALVLGLRCLLASKSPRRGSLGFDRYVPNRCPTS